MSASTDLLLFASPLVLAVSVAVQQIRTSIVLVVAALVATLTRDNDRYRRALSVMRLLLNNQGAAKHSARRRAISERRGPRGIRPGS